METIGCDVGDGVATITLNRSDRLNAWTPQMGDELVAAFDGTDADSRAIARGTSADVREGVAASLDKRPAAYPDRVGDGLPDASPDWVESTF